MEFYFQPADQVSEAELLTVAATVEKGSEHPLSGAILAKARQLRLNAIQ